MKGAGRDLGVDKTRLVRNYITPVTPGWAALTESHWGRRSDSSLVRNLYRTQLGDSDQLVR